MRLLALPLSIIADIIILYLRKAKFGEGWKLRRVCRAFNDEILRAYFVLELEVESLNSTATYFQFARNSFIIQSKLQAMLTTTAHDVPVWLYNIRQALDSLSRIRSKQPASANDCASQWSRFALYKQRSTRTALCDPTLEAICGAVAWYFRFSELDKHLSENSDGRDSEYMQRSSHFWLFAVACYSGDLELLEQALADLQGKFEYMGGAGSHNMCCSNSRLLGQGERQPYHWKEALSPCLTLAAREGHTPIVSRLLEEGFQVDVMSPHGKTGVLVAVEFRQVGVLDVLLDPSREWERRGRCFDEAIVEAGGIRDNALRRRILMLLTTNDSRTLSPSARDSVFDLASDINDVHLARWVMSHGKIDAYGIWGINFPQLTPLAIAVKHDNHDMFRLIMDNTDSFAPAMDNRIYLQAYRTACRQNRLAQFLELVKVLRNMTPECAFMDAAMVEGASAMIESIMGAVDLDSRATRILRVPGDIEGATGERALLLATIMLRPRNITFLLRRGCRLSSTATVRPKTYTSDDKDSITPAILQKVIGLHAEYGCSLTFTKP